MYVEDSGRISFQLECTAVSFSEIENGMIFQEVDECSKTPLQTAFLNEVSLGERG